MEKNRQERIENASSTEKNEVERPAASISAIDLKNYDTAEKIVLFIWVNHIVESSKTVNAGAEENLNKPEFKFMVDFRKL